MRDTYYIIVVEKDDALYGKIVSALGKLGCNHNIRRVSSEEELDEELVRLAPDFVICTESRSPWNSFAVLGQVRAFESTLPFAVIRGPEEAETLPASDVDACLDRDHLGDLVPKLEELMKRRTERQRACVDEIRRSFLQGRSARRRARRQEYPFGAS